MLKHVRCHFKLIFDISWLWWETVSWILWTEESSWDILNKKKCCLSSTMWTLKSRKCENRFIYSISKNDAYGLWCGLWWDSVTLGEFTQGIHAVKHANLEFWNSFSFGNSQFKICFIFMLILLLNIRLAVRHLWSPKMLG